MWTGNEQSCAGLSAASALGIDEYMLRRETAEGGYWGGFEECGHVLRLLQLARIQQRLCCKSTFRADRQNTDTTRIRKGTKDGCALRCTDVIGLAVGYVHTGVTWAENVCISQFCDIDVYLVNVLE